MNDSNRNDKRPLTYNWKQKEHRMKIILLAALGLMLGLAVPDTEAGCPPGCDKACCAGVPSATATQHEHPGHSAMEVKRGAAAPEHPAAPAELPVLKESYPWTTCPISGQKLGSMGDPYSIELEGLTVRLCCDGCEKKARARAAEITADLRKAVIERDSRDYPLEECLTCGMHLKDGRGLDMVHGSTMVRLCGEMCRVSFEGDPEARVQQVLRARNEQAKRQ